MSIQALQDVKVVDFCWYAAGPLTTKYLADHGAQVIRIESITHIDGYRMTPPFKDCKPGVNRSTTGTSLNNNKLGMTINLYNPKGLDLAKRVISWADIVVENYAPGIMSKLGLDYEVLRQVKPEIIMLSLSNQGQTGPHSSHPAFGMQLTALAGFAELTGWPDRTPIVVHGGYTDTIAPRFAVTTLIAALDYRKRTGKGQHLDLSQYETAIQFLAPLILDYNVNDHIESRVGNHFSYAVPHSAYPCRGEDMWCVIAVFTDDEWRSLCMAVDHPEWIEDPRFSTLLSRKENEDELDALIAQWTSNLSPYEVMNKLQEAGVAAGVVESCGDLFSDAQLKYRRHFQPLEHAEIGIHNYQSPSFRMSKTPAELRMAAPCLGQHNEYVCTEILGMSDAEFVTLLAEGIFE